MSAKTTSNDPLDRSKQIYKDNPAITHSRGRTSEADTRANILDHLIHDVLLWPRDAVDRETYARPGFLDYVLVYGRPVLIIEAKSERTTFGLP